jgi:hypothetical protein
MNASLDSGESIGSENALDHHLRALDADFFLCVSMHYYNGVGFFPTLERHGQIVVAVKVAAERHFEVHGNSDLNASCGIPSSANYRSVAVHATSFY